MWRRAVSSGETWVGVLSKCAKAAPGVQSCIPVARLYEATSAEVAPDARSRLCSAVSLFIRATPKG